jgi:hypothetical protein
MGPFLRGYGICKCMQSHNLSIANAASYHESLSILSTNNEPTNVQPKTSAVLLIDLLSFENPSTLAAAFYL